MLTTIEIYGEKRKARFIERFNRFEALAECGGETVLCHVANTGRMKGLLVPGREVVLRRAENPDRKTKWDLILAHTANGVPVLLEAVMANRLVLKAIKEGRLEGFEGWTDIRREAVYGSSRFDAKLTDRGGTYDLEGKKTAPLPCGRICYIEVKCVTLVENGVARFPDAPTERGTKHVLELMRAKSQGYGASVIVVAQREDAKSFTPNRETDPRFSEAIALAAEAGVMVYAYNCRVTQDSITLLGRIPANLGID
jgi:sugar fermentation stimulation protein A